MIDTESAEGLDRAAISIVTVVKNNIRGLVRTFSSLEEQDFLNWEMIIVDGNSGDGSLELAQNLANQDSRIRLIQQTDSGIYAGMNLGLLQVKGQYVLFLNSGDILAGQQTLSNLLEILESKAPDLLVGGYSYKELGKEFVYAKRSKWISANEISLNRRGLCHQSMVYRRDTLIGVGKYDITYSLAADFNSALLIAKSGKVFRTNLVLSKIELGGISQSQIMKVLKEKQASRVAIFGFISFGAIMGTFWSLGVKTKMKLNGSK